MSDEHLSLTSSAPPPPTEADYEAIAAAVMETVRGRWFLGEYARRNRNAVLHTLTPLGIALLDTIWSPQRQPDLVRTRM